MRSSTGVASLTKRSLRSNGASIGEPQCAHPHDDDVGLLKIFGPTDYDPRSASESFLQHVQPLYDKYCKTGSTKFAMGETGYVALQGSVLQQQLILWLAAYSTGWEANIKERIAWLDQLTSAETGRAMPYYVGSTDLFPDSRVSSRVNDLDDLPCPHSRLVQL